jgi:hypothetical protein
MRKIAAALFFVSLSTFINQSGSANASEVLDPRQGEPVKKICFASAINGWREIAGERHAVIVSKGVKEEYKLELFGVCDVSQAINSLGVSTRGSSCLTRGDDIVIKSTFSGSTKCSIKQIYTWNENADDTQDQ